MTNDADIYKDEYGRIHFIDIDGKDWTLTKQQVEDRRKLID